MEYNGYIKLKKKKIEVFFSKSIWDYTTQLTTMKTSKRTNTRTHKGHTRKNGGVRVTHTIPLTEWTRWFYDNYTAGATPMSAETGMEYGKKAIIHEMKDGNKIPEIIKKYMENLKRKRRQMIEYKAIYRHIYSSFPEYVEKQIGVSHPHYLVDWICSVAVCMKLKAIKNDAKNGYVEYMADEKGNY